MASMKLFTHTLTVELETGPDLKEITPKIKGILESANILTGVLHAFVVGSTGSMTTIEYKAGVIEDLKRTLTELVPPDRPYAHELAWQPFWGPPFPFHTKFKINLRYLAAGGGD